MTGRWAFGVAGASVAAGHPRGGTVMGLVNGEPIWIRCEGSGCPPAAMQRGLTMGIGICSMCGQPWTVIGGVVLDHRRDDIVARLKRGDFG